MSRFKAGETSKGVLAKKAAITESLYKKAKLIKAIKKEDDIYPTLVVKRNSIALIPVLRWKDDELGVISCAYNTAHENYNEVPLKALLDSIDIANNNLENEQLGEKDSTNEKSALFSQEDVKLLISENDELRNALAEVYRAYIQTLDNIKEDTVVNEVLQSLLRNQALVLGNQRIWKIK